LKLDQAGKIAGVVGRNLLWGGNVASLSLITKPRSMMHYISESLLLYKKLNKKEGIAQKQIYDVLPANDAEDIILGGLKSGTWFWNAQRGADIVNLCLICQILKPRVVFEIGTLTGYSAFHFGLNTSPDARVYTLDLPKNEIVDPQMEITFMDRDLTAIHAETERYAFDDSAVASKITRLFGDSATFDFSPYHDAVDLFFIDGAHSYDYVRSDTLNALKCCHPGSVIAWHDFGRVGGNGVSRWIVEFSKEHDVYTPPSGSLAFMVVK